MLATNPPPAVRRNIDIYLAEIEESEKRDFYSGQISMGLDWDDNVYVAPANEVLETVIGGLDFQCRVEQRLNLPEKLTTVRSAGWLPPVVA